MKSKRLLRCRGKSGFTLAEVIIASALLGILIIGMFAFITPILSTVTSTNENTRASNAAESVQYYISRSLRNASHVTIFTDAKRDDVLSKGSAEIQNLVTAVSKLGSSYSIKCISIRYVGNKYAICNEEYDAASNAFKTADLESSKVFDDCYFPSIYPKVTFDTINEVKDDGSVGDQMPSVKMVVSMYDDAEMDTDASAPKKNLVFEGTGYTVLRNIELAKQNKEITNVSERLVINSLKPSDDDEAKSSVDTYIFYIERTLAVSSTPDP